MAVLFVSHLNKDDALAGTSEKRLLTNSFSDLGHQFRTCRAAAISQETKSERQLHEAEPALFGCCEARRSHNVGADSDG